VGTEVKNFIDAQFRNTWLAALAAYHGRIPGPGWQADATLGDTSIRNLMKKVRVVVHPKEHEIITSRSNAGQLLIYYDVIVEITAKGKRFIAEISEAKGPPGNPMTDGELREKFRNNASYSTLATDRIEKVIETVYELDKIDNITRLMKLLTVIGG
jgi:2-methylcitrate dehydratase PrpD